MDLYDQIVKEQVFISYMCNGISFEVTNAMSPYERKLVHTIIDEIKQQEIEALKKKSK